MDESLELMQKRIQNVPVPRRVKKQNITFLIYIGVSILSIFFVLNNSFENFLFYKYAFLVIAVAVPIVTYFQSKAEYDLLANGTPIIAEVANYFDIHKNPEVRRVYLKVTYKCNGKEYRSAVSYDKTIPEETPEKRVVLLIDLKEPKKNILFDKGIFYRLDLN